MSALYRDDDDSGSDSDAYDENDGDLYRGRDAYIFLVDAFLYENPERFQQTLDLIKKSMVSGLLIREKDLIGIVINNTEKSPAPKDTTAMENIKAAENTAVLLPLKELTKVIVDYYMAFAVPPHTKAPFDFESKFGIKQGNFSNTMRLCSSMFLQCGHKLTSMTVAYFTDRDTPQDLNSQEFQKALLKAKDMNQMFIEFNVIPMRDDFDYSVFYKEFMCIVAGNDDLESFVVPNPETEQKNIANRNFHQSFQKNCQAHLHWSLGEGVDLAVCFYNFFKKDVYPRAVKIFREDNSVIKVKRVNKIGDIEPETQTTGNERYMKPGDERKIITIGGQKISFASDEVAKIRSPIAPGLKLIGFIDNSEVSIHKFLKSSGFIYPDETMISGSVKLFRALWERCMEKEKIAVCVLVTRRKSKPRFVALVPSEFQEGLRNDGFRVHFLPFADSYRNMDLSNWSTQTASTHGIDLFKNIIKKLRQVFGIEKINDPTFNTLHSDICGLAFDVEVESTGESGMPDEAEFDSRISGYLEDFFETFRRDLDIAGPPKRRANGTAAGAGPTKKQKITDDQVNREFVQHLITLGDLPSLSVKQLKSYLQASNVEGLTGTKAALIEKVMDLHND